MSRGKVKKPEISEGGRPRSSWPVVEGIAVLAAQLGVSEAVIKQVKRNGSRAFLTHNRIDTGILIPELFASLTGDTELPEGVRSPQEWLTTEKAKREQIKRENEQKLTMPTADAKRQNGEAWAYVFSALNQLCNEAPPSLAGLDSVTIFKKLSEFVERMRKEAKQKFEQAA